MTSGEDRELEREVVAFGVPARLPWRRLGGLTLAALLVGAVAVAATHPTSHRPPPPAPVTVISVGHPILGVRAGWQLFGLDHSGLVRVQFARGEIVRTIIPHLKGDGLASLVAAPGAALVRPLDNVTGYLVPDGKPARPLTGVLAQGGALLPGPSSAQEWLDRGSILLVGRGGKREDAHLAMLTPLFQSNPSVAADGRGGFLLTVPSGEYDAGLGMLKPVNAMLLATGPRNWLGVSCGQQGSCQDVVISAATGTSKVLPGPIMVGTPWPWQAMPGRTAPDGSTAAVIMPGQGTGKPSLELINLSSGASVRASVPVAAGSSSQSLAWSPDSRWLFVVTARGTLAAVDTRTGHVNDVRLGVSGLTQIVVAVA